MALNRVRVLDLGGFDELFRGDAAAEDCDFCYRWLRAGGSPRYAPNMVVWHADWRDDAQLDRLYTRYWYCIAFLYAKHLRKRDFAIIRFMVRSLFVAVHGTGSWMISRRTEAIRSPARLPARLPLRVPERLARPRPRPVDDASAVSAP